MSREMGVRMLAFNRSIRTRATSMRLNGIESIWRCFGGASAALLQVLGRLWRRFGAIRAALWRRFFLTTLPVPFPNMLHHLYLRHRLNAPKLFFPAQSPIRPRAHTFPHPPLSSLLTSLPSRFPPASSPLPSRFSPAFFPLLPTPN